MLRLQLMQVGATQIDQEQVKILSVGAEKAGLKVGCFDNQSHLI